MELRHLRYFTVLAEVCHFGQAAERLHMTQPPLSQQIRQLEAELGVELLTRTTRNVRLTPAGEFFRHDAVRILQSVDDAVRRVRRFAGGKSGLLTVGLTGTASFTQLPVIARLLKEQLPGVGLDIQTEMLTPVQEEALAAGTLDIAVLRPPTREDTITWRPIAREGWVVALPETHRLAAADTVTMGELRAEQFIMYPSGSRSVVNDAVLRACLAAGFYPSIGHESDKTSTQLSLVAAGLGIAVLPESVCGMSLKGVVYRPLPDADPIELALAWRRADDSPLLDAFIAMLEGNNFFIDSDTLEGSLEDHRN